MNLGKLLVYVGLGLAAAGLLVILGSKLGLPRLGRLPGDIVYEGKNGTFYFPIVACIIVSILLSLVVSIFRR
jgi:hypothetical protein